MKRAVVALLVASCALCARARADVWDEGPANDDAMKTTRNELIHGTTQVHDLGAHDGVPDVDWYVVQTASNSSFEVVVEGLTGGLVGPAAPIVELTDDKGQPFQTAAAVTGFGTARRLSSGWAGSVGVEQRYHVRVRGAACGTTCTAADQYRIRLSETTVRLPRFNTEHGQTTVLIVQNPTNRPTALNVYLFVGRELTGFPATLQPNEVLAFNLASDFGGKSGGILILNDAPYGVLGGKAVQVDPATGFVFETPLSYRPY
jgi:hypothetical protein